MRLQLARRRTFWFPTFAGWLCLVIAVGAPTLLWWFQGESFLATTQRQPADVLVVEGWIGIEGVQAAKEEFVQGGYSYVVATGGMSGNRWDVRRWSYAAEAADLLLRLGLPPDRVILATPRETGEHRTYEAAVASRTTLAARGIRPRTVNVFTFGVHARRSRLVYAKAFPGEIAAGVIAWSPAAYFSNEPWWRSSGRASEFLKESVGYLLELIFASGRGLFPVSNPSIMTQNGDHLQKDHPVVRQ